ncbi:hypothetical protein [Streptomyces sp. NPDC017890]|uniref:hypothetical protein n=1 Tax=Streptomyces sp. NPDC017890 TaxID=3365015 RepID=UPI0037B2CAC9
MSISASRSRLRHVWLGWGAQTAFLTVICYDADVPALNRIDADTVLVPGGDGPGVGRTHMWMAGLRAIDNGYALVRQNFNGQSTAYDSYGRTLPAQDTTNESGVWYTQVPSFGTGSLHRHTGDLLGRLALAGTATASGLAAGWFPRGRRAPRTPTPERER